MKRTLFLIAALLPFAATAGESAGAAGLDNESLRDDYSAKEIIGSEVKSRDGRNVGEIEEVIFTTDGDVAAVLVELETEGMNDANTPLDSGEVADTEGTPEIQADDNAVGYDTGGMGPNDTLAEIEFRNADYQPEANVLTVDMDANEIQRAPRRNDDDETLMTRNEIKASELIGMEVDLADEESFGEVEDVLISRDGGKPTAFVVDTMDFLDKKTYALPAKVDAVNQEENVVSYEEYSLQQIEQLEEYQADDTFESM